MAVVAAITVFWGNETMHNVVDRYRRFGRTYFFTAENIISLYTRLPKRRLMST